MINLRTLVVGTLLFCIIVVSGCFGSEAPTPPEPSPTPALPPSPTATATPLPSFGPFIPLGQPVHRNLGTSTEVVRNCVPGAVDPIVKTPSRSLIASHNVEWSVAGTAGIGTSIGGGVLPVEVNLDVSLTTTYGQGYSETTERGTGWQLPAKPNTIVTYILAWGEKWQPGFVEVRLWNQPAIKIDVFYRTDVTSEIVAEDAQDCDGTRTEEPVPSNTLPTNTPSPTATNTPQIQATNTQPTMLQPPVPTIHGESVSPETLARIVGGDARYWKQAGGVVWVYSNENNNTTMRHPGENMVLTYWAGFGEPQNADSCQNIISPKNAFEIAVKCKSGTNAQIVADQVGLHIIDDTGFFP